MSSILAQERYPRDSFCRSKPAVRRMAHAFDGEGQTAEPNVR